MSNITCRLTAKKLDQLNAHNRAWDYFFVGLEGGMHCIEGFLVPHSTYLGVHLLAGRSIIDMSPTKCLFYAACNSILNHANNLDETVQPRLQESYTLPILTYSIATLDLKAKQQS